jgi:hypothetical protein
MASFTGTMMMTQILQRRVAVENCMFIKLPINDVPLGCGQEYVYLSFDFRDLSNKLAPKKKVQHGFVCRNKDDSNFLE